MSGGEKECAPQMAAAIRVIVIAAAVTRGLSGPAVAQTAEPTVQELQKQIRQRDA